MTNGKYVSEHEFNAKAVAPRVTLKDLEANIAAEYYFRGHEAATAGGARGFKLEVAVPLSLTTYCVLVLQNGFTVTGTSACASPENFDEDIGRRVAKGDATRQVWALMGYALREKLHRLQSLEQAGLGEALTRMTAFGLGNSEAFRMQDADRILSHFLHERSEEGGAVIEESLKTAVDLANLPVVSAEEPPMFTGYHELDQTPEPEENEPEGA